MRIAIAFVTIALAGIAGCAAGPSAAPAANGLVSTGRSAGPVPLTLPASFTGTLPCADCEGVDYRLDLFEDRSFFLRTTYRGRTPGDFDDVGSFDWSSDRRALIAQGGREAPLRFSIESADEIRLLDVSGQPIDSKLNYSLRRASGLAPLEPRLNLRGLYRYMADAGLFDECSTGRRMPVAMEADNAALERAYGEQRPEPLAPVMALVEGRIAMRMPMEGPGPVPTLVPERFLRLMPGESCPPRFATMPLEGTAWRLVGLGGEAVTPPASRPGPSMTLDAAESRVSGTDGCNRFMGGFRRDGDSLAFAQLASTMMACADGMEEAQRFTKALGATARYRAMGVQLELFDAAGAVVARFQAQPATE
ncbi:MAG: META domain-containing protein [Steroidobacteraceae bacterium]|nr:META domain-containing protein [Steroidobacteraceae bacterium]